MSSSNVLNGFLLNLVSRFHTKFLGRTLFRFTPIYCNIYFTWSPDWNFSVFYKAALILQEINPRCFTRMFKKLKKAQADLNSTNNVILYMGSLEQLTQGASGDLKWRSRSNEITPQLVAITRRANWENWICEKWNCFKKYGTHFVVTIVHKTARLLRNATSQTVRETFIFCHLKSRFYTGQILETVNRT
jgi:hypothetical protein